MTPVPSPTIDMLGPFHLSVQPGLLFQELKHKKNKHFKAKKRTQNMSNQTTTTTYSVLVDALIYINDVTKVYIGSLQAARTILGLTTATGRRPATSSRAASPRAWWWLWWWWCVMIIISWSLELPPWCKCRNLAGFQSACWSSSWTALGPSSEEKFKV